jgi:hypothetical protein
MTTQDNKEKLKRDELTPENIGNALDVAMEREINREKVEQEKAGEKGE